MKRLDDDNKRLVHVHMYHRHGARSPAHHLDKAKGESGRHKVWIPLLAKQYSSADAIRKALAGEPHELHHWTSVNQKLNGTYLKPLRTSMDDEKAITRDAKRSSGMWMGQLTDSGANQMEDLGQWLRRRYIDELCFLPRTYVTSHGDNIRLHIESTNFKRTIYSVDSLVRGLYPLEHRQNGNSIPIHLDREWDHLLIVNEIHRGAKEFYHGKNGMFWSYSDKNPQSVRRPENIPKEIKEIAEKLKLDYDIDGSVPYSVDAGALRQRMKQNVGIPQTVSEEDVWKYINYFDRPIEKHFQRSDMLRIGYGVLLNELLEEIKKESGMFVVSSAHDWTVYPLMRALLRHCSDEIKEKHGQWPSYAASIIFEVWETEDGKRMVRLIHDREVMPLDGREFIEIEEIEKMWRDIIMSRQMLYNM